jgi:hypothetical protein
MKKIICLMALSFIIVSGLEAQVQAVVKEVSGKVEVKAAGASAWLPAKAGLKLAKGSFVSTGFNSTALLELGPSLLSVKPLTRMQLEELIAKEGTVSTELFLKVGKVKAELKSGVGLKQDFTLKSPVSTAAVRGTEFEFDGLTVKVVNGLVFFSNTLGQGRGVGAGEQSTLSGTELPTSGDQENGNATQVDPYAAAGGGVTGAGTQVPGTATVTIRW